MGGTTSAENVSDMFNKTVNTTVNSALVNMARQTQAVSTITQNIDFSGLKCGGDINISGVSQKAIATINTSIMSKNMNQNTLSSMLTNAAQQASDSDQNATANFLANTLSKTDTSSSTKTVNDVINTVSNSYTLNDFQNDMQSINADQTMNFANMSSDKKCTIKDLSQYASLDIVSKNISDRMTTTLTDLLTKTDYDQAVKNHQVATSTGPLEGLAKVFGAIGDIFTGPIGYAIVAMVLIIGVIIVVVIIMKMSGGRRQMYPMGYPNMNPNMYQGPGSYGMYPPEPFMPPLVQPTKQ